MTIRLFYSGTGGNYEEIIKWMKKRESVAHFVRKYPADPNFEIFKTAYEAGNYKEAFYAANKVRKIARKLSFTLLHDLIRELMVNFTQHNFKVDKLFQEIVYVNENILFMLMYLE